MAVKFNPLSGQFDLVLDKASEIQFDPASTSLSSTDVQAAIDEVDARIVATEAVANAAIPSSEKAAALGVATLDAGGKVPASQLPNSVMDYLGTWAASTNTPTLANGTGNAGDVYIASDAGTVNFGAGGITFAAGDWVIYSGSVWEKSSNANSVASVNGFTGVVVLDTDDISEGTAQYFTDERAQDAVGGIVTNSSKVSLTYVDGTPSITADIVAGSLVNNDINAGAAIAYSKLNLSSSIVNSDVATAAAIDRSKLASGTANRVVVNDNLGVQSDAAAITASRALISDANGIPTHSATTDTELGYVSGVTSAIQTQLNARVEEAVVTTKGDLIVATASATVARLPAGTDGQILAANSAVANGLEYVDGPEVADFQVDRFSGNGSTVNFTLGADPGTENNTWVNISGVYQQKDTYSISGTTLTFSTAPPTGTNNIEVVRGATVTLAIPASASVTKAKFSPTALNKTVRSVTSTDTATSSDEVLVLSGASFTQNLPSASGIPGKELTIIHNGTTTSQQYTVDPSGSETIDGSTTYIMHTKNQVLKIMSDGTNWLSVEKSKIAGHVGTAYYPVTASAVWSRTNTAMGAFTADTDAPSPTVETNPGPGTIQTTDNNLPQITINDLPPGQYRVCVMGIGAPSGGNANIAYALSDGTTTTGEQGGASILTTTPAGFVVEGVFTYTSTANRTFEVHGRASSDTVNIFLDRNRLVFQVYRLGDA